MLYCRFSVGIKDPNGSIRLWNKCGQMILLKYYKDIPGSALRGIEDPLGLGMPSPAPHRQPSPSPVNTPPKPRTGAVFPFSSRFRIVSPWLAAVELACDRSRFFFKCLTILCDTRSNFLLN